jgi:hypothetical protein
VNAVVHDVMALILVHDVLERETYYLSNPRISSSRTQKGFSAIRRDDVCAEHKRSPPDGGKAPLN